MRFLNFLRSLIWKPEPALEGKAEVVKKKIVRKKKNVNAA
jgi:hypothetical protein